MKNGIQGLLLALCVLLLGVLLSLNFHQYQLFKKVLGQLHQGQKKYSLDQNKLVNLKKIQQQNQTLLQKLNVLEQAMPDQPLEDNIVTVLAMQAEKAGLQLTHLYFESYIQNKDFIEVPTKINLQGDYFGLLQMLEELQSQPRHLRINQIKIESANQETNLIQVELLVTFFYVPKS